MHVILWRLLIIDFLPALQHAFGRTLGNWILLPPQLIVLVGLGITYTCAHPLLCCVLHALCYILWCADFPSTPLRFLSGNA